MKIISLTALLLASTVTVATATPQDREPTERVSYTKETPKAAAPSTDWVELATPTPCAHGRTFVTLEADAMPITRLRIDAHKGRAVIQMVKVVYADGKQRVVKLDKKLDARGNRSAFIDLKGSKQIESIRVDSDHRAKGSYTIHGAPDRDAVATR